MTTPLPCGIDNDLEDYPFGCTTLSLMSNLNLKVQVILFEIDCAIFYTNSLKFFFQFISWTILVNSGKFMDNGWISFQNMADMKKVYEDLIIINL